MPHQWCRVNGDARCCLKKCNVSYCLLLFFTDLCFLLFFGPFTSDIWRLLFSIIYKATYFSFFCRILVHLSFFHTVDSKLQNLNKLLAERHIGLQQVYFLLCYFYYTTGLTLSVDYMILMCIRTSDGIISICRQLICVFTISLHATYKIAFKIRPRQFRFDAHNSWTTCAIVVVCNGRSRTSAILDFWP